MSDTTTTTENMEQVTEQEKEMQEAQASGVVNFDDKKKDKEEDGSLNYTHTFKKPREIEGKTYTKLTFYFDNLTGDVYKRQIYRQEEDEMAKATTASATAAEKDAEKVQAVENTTTEEKATETANKQEGTVKLIYIGPNLPKAMLQCNKIFEGTKEEIKKELSFILEKFPLVEKMLVPTTELAEKKDKVKTTGTVSYTHLDVYKRQV